MSRAQRFEAASGLRVWAVLACAAAVTFGCTTHQEFVFGPVIHIDAPWRYASEKGAPVTLGVVHGDRHSVALERLELTPLDGPLAAPGGDRRRAAAAEGEFLPRYVAFLRRDEGERFAGRPSESDSLLAATPHLEIRFVAGDPSVGGVRMLERRDDGPDECGDRLRREQRWMPAYVGSLADSIEGSAWVGPPFGWARALGKGVVRLATLPVGFVRANLWDPFFGTPERDPRDAPLDELVSHRGKDETRREELPWACYAAVDELRLRCPSSAPCFWRAELTYWRPSAETARDLVYGPPILLHSIPRSIGALLHGDPKRAGAVWVEYRDSRNTRLRYTKVIRVERHGEKKPACDGCFWAAGDTHVHTRYSDHFAESGHGTQATGVAASEIGLDWVTTTDHANDASGLGMDDTGFREQTREITGFNDRRESLPDKGRTADPRHGALMIQGEEIAVARRYDDSDNIYHMLAYQWARPEFVSGRIAPLGEEVGFSDVLQVFTGNAPQGKAQRTIEEIADQYPPSLGFALIAHPEEDYLERAVKLQRKWTYEDFEVALRNRNIRGMELWNTDIFETRSVYDFWRVNTPDFGRVSSLGLSKWIAFAPLALTNVALSPLTYLLNSAGATNSPTLWGLSPRFDVEIDPRFDTSTSVVRERNAWGRWFSSGFEPSFFRSRDFDQPFHEFLNSAMPWAQTGIYDSLLDFGYSEFSIGLAMLAVVTSFDNWVSKRSEGTLVDDLQDFSKASVRVAFWLPGALGRTTGYCVVELPFREIRGDDSFWSRTLWMPPDTSEPSCDEFRSKDDPLAFLDYEPVPRTEADAASWSLDDFYAADWYVVRERAATRKWVELYAGIDLWDYGILRRAEAFLRACPNDDVCPLQSLSTAQADTIAGARQLASRADELRFVAAAGTDAHGGFNYMVEQPTLYEININNSALGRVRTVARVPDEDAPSEVILGAVASGASYLTNGLHASISVSSSDPEYPVGSIVVGTLDQLSQMRLKREDPDGDEGRLYVAAIGLGADGGIEPLGAAACEPHPMEDYGRVFREISREGAEAARLLHEFRYEDYFRRFYGDYCESREGEAGIPGWRWLFDLCSSRYDFVSEFQKAVRVDAAVLQRLLSRTETNSALLTRLVRLNGEPTVGRLLREAGVTGEAAHRRVAYVRYELERDDAQLGRSLAITNPIWFVVEPDPGSSTAEPETSPTCAETAASAWTRDTDAAARHR